MNHPIRSQVAPTLSKDQEEVLTSDATLFATPAELAVLQVVGPLARSADAVIALQPVPGDGSPVASVLSPPGGVRPAALHVNRSRPTGSPIRARSATFTIGFPAAAARSAAPSARIVLPPKSTGHRTDAAQTSSSCTIYRAAEQDKARSVLTVSKPPSRLLPARVETGLSNGRCLFVEVSGLS
jgi:hypothetical protein